jgi:hypothetical protein
MVWTRRPSPATRRHYAPWCDTWAEEENEFILRWTRPEIRRYYLYHLFLHEVGHINQPCFNSASRREEYAENFALEWARELGEL